VIVIVIVTVNETETETGERTTGIRTEVHIWSLFGFMDVTTFHIFTFSSSSSFWDLSASYVLSVLLFHIINKSVNTVVDIWCNIYFKQRYCNSSVFTMREFIGHCSIGLMLLFCLQEVPSLNLSWET
jgi:hypothetical protein